MAVWTPGSYLVREFSRNFDSVQATDPGGAALSVDKTRKNRWRVQTGGAPRVTVRYRVYAAEISVRTSWVSDDLAVLNGAGLLMAPAGDLVADPALLRAYRARPPTRPGRRAAAARSGGFRRARSARARRCTLPGRPGRPARRG